MEYVVCIVTNFLFLCLLMLVHIGTFEFGWTPWWCKAARSDKAGHRPSAMLPLQSGVATGTTDGRLLWLCVISDVMCRVPRWLWVSPVAPCSSLQAWISCTMCRQMVKGIGFCECFYYLGSLMFGIHLMSSMLFSIYIHCFILKSAVKWLILNLINNKVIAG